MHQPLARSSSHGSTRSVGSHGLYEACSWTCFGAARSGVAALIGGDLDATSNFDGPFSTWSFGDRRLYEQPFSWSDHLSMLTPKRFTDRYRLTPDGFDILYELV